MLLILCCTRVIPLLTIIMRSKGQTICPIFFVNLLFSYHRQRLQLQDMLIARKGISLAKHPFSRQAQPKDPVISLSGQLIVILNGIKKTLKGVSSTQLYPRSAYSQCPAISRSPSSRQRVRGARGWWRGRGVPESLGRCREATPAPPCRAAPPSCRASRVC